MKKAKVQKIINLKITEPVLYGSINKVWIRCGKKNCICYQSDSQRHGPYYQWTGNVNGKRATVLIRSEEVAKECYKRIKNYKKILEQLEKIKQQAINMAPWKMPDK